MNTRDTLTAAMVVVAGIGGISSGLSGNTTAATWALALLVVISDLHMQTRINALLKRRADWGDIEAEVLCQLRRWLKGGATIKATDPEAEVLHPTNDGHYIGGLTVTFEGPARELTVIDAERFH